ncbi:hypothetical protein D3C87_1523710 [compost metagenome]
MFGGHAPGAPQQYGKENESADTESQRGDIPQAQFARHAEARHDKPAGEDQDAKGGPAETLKGFARWLLGVGRGSGSDGGILDGVGKLRHAVASPGASWLTKALALQVPCNVWRFYIDCYKTCQH